MFCRVINKWGILVKVFIVNNLLQTDFNVFTQVYRMNIIFVIDEMLLFSTVLFTYLEGWRCNQQC